MPYWPIVNAIAPKAPTGAAFIKIATSLKTALVADSSMASNGSPRSPINASAMPKRIATNSTCRISPSANAETSVVGMTFIRKPTMLWSCAFAV